MLYGAPENPSKHAVITYLAPLPGRYRVRGIKRSAWIGMSAVALLAVVAYVGYVYRAVPDRFEKKSPNTKRILISSAMSLWAVRTGGEIVVTWNATAPAVTAARVGVLSVKDGAINREIPLNQAQLREAKLVYLPQSEQLEVVLEVFSATGEALRESIIVEVDREAVQRADDATFEASPPNETTHRAAPQESDRPNARVRSFVPPVAAGRRPPSDAVLVSDAPPVQVAHAVTPQASVVPPVVGAPILPPPPRLMTTQPARSARQVRPAVPANVIALLRAPTHIRVRVEIDAQGNVTRAEALTPADAGVSGFLNRSAVEAARLWSFTPARQGSVSVPSEMVLSFVFGE